MQCILLKIVPTEQTRQQWSEMGGKRTEHLEFCLFVNKAWKIHFVSIYFVSFELNKLESGNMEPFILDNSLWFIFCVTSVQKCPKTVWQGHWISVFFRVPVYTVYIYITVSSKSKSYPVKIHVLAQPKVEGNKVNGSKTANKYMVFFPFCFLHSISLVRLLEGKQYMYSTARFRLFNSITSYL